jgi:hypothetical protein
MEQSGFTGSEWSDSSRAAFSIAKIDAPAIVAGRQSERLLVTSAERIEQAGRGRPRGGRLAPQAAIAPGQPAWLLPAGSGSASNSLNHAWLSSNPFVALETGWTTALS